MASKWLDDNDFDNSPESLRMQASYDSVVDEGLEDLKGALHVLGSLLEDVGLVEAAVEVYDLAADNDGLYNVFVTGGWQHDVKLAKKLLASLLDVDGGATAASEILGDLESTGYEEF